MFFCLECLNRKLGQMIYNILIYLLCLIDFVISSTMDKANQLLAQGRMPEAADAYSDVISKDPK